MSVPHPALRVGVMLNGPNMSLWFAECLREAVRLGHIDVVAWIMPANPVSAPARGRLSSYWINRRTLPYAILQRLDAMRTGIAPDPERTTTSDIAVSAAEIRVHVERTRFSDRISSDGLERIRALKLDLLLRGGFRILRGEVLAAARLGVWSFHHGDSREFRGGPPAAWEVLLDRPTTGVVLQRLSEDLDAGEVLASTVCRTQRFSIARNRRAIYSRSSRLLLRALERARAPQATVEPSSPAPTWQAYDRPLYTMPEARDLVRTVPRTVATQVGLRLQTLKGNWHWSIGWHYSRTGSDIPHGSLYAFHEVRPPLDRFWADPFPVQGPDGRHWVFLEEYLYSTARGRINAWEWSAKGPVGDCFPVLDTPFHLSYPQVFRHRGDTFMLPECDASRKLTLYRARRFPDEWEPVATLLDGIRATDSTLVEIGGVWYLFTSLFDEAVEPGEELHLFMANSPLGPFAAHPQSPIVSDIRHARMAGSLFRVRGRLFRPAQIGVPHYGAGIVVREVAELSPRSYEERPHAEMRPHLSRGILGCHTLNAAAGLTVTDFLRRRRGVPPL